MTESLHHIIIIIFGIIPEGGNGLLVKASKSRLKPVKAGGLDFTNKNRFLPTLVSTVPYGIISTIFNY